ncbi:hypothetical protein F2P56_020724 [Juglans regia]|uniref:Uncharacterized protein n=1 Tax=Juglans regia TaxID=51240 RepID=A0A833UUQ5_JUGRE|nr:hypothetical protein F2P56_020724 [Juglans regia]
METYDHGFSVHSRIAHCVPETMKFDIGSELVLAKGQWVGQFVKVIGTLQVSSGKPAKCDMQGTSMEGPILSNISRLTNLTQLWLRNCLITGPIPDYIGELKALKELDLSFNRLSGPIPEQLGNLDLDYMFLANNSLNGEVPTGILNNPNKLDISYNNFSGSPM